MSRASLRRQGFTLIEMLTVSGIMALFSITLISVFLASFRGGTKAGLVQILRQNGDFALTAIVREVRRAEKITCAGTELTVSKIDGGEIIYTNIDNRIASDSSYLTSPGLTVNNLNFICYDGQIGNQIMTASFTLTAGQESSQTQEKLSQEFATSVATRQH